MILDLIRGKADGFQLLINILTRIFVIFCILPIHEFAHALVADKMGDDTARLKGRLTISPMAHINWLGAAMILLCGFGYANPVPVNPRNFKNPKKGMAITALAGPVANLIMALFFCLLMNGAGCAIIRSGETNQYAVPYIIYYFCYYAAYINVSLAVFNLIPIPPLDGSRILNVVLPAKYYFKIMQYERYILIAIFVLLLTGALSYPLQLLTNLVYKLINLLAGLPFRALM